MGDLNLNTESTDQPIRGRDEEEDNDPEVRNPENTDQDWEEDGDSDPEIRKLEGENL